MKKVLFVLMLFVSIGCLGQNVYQYDSLTNIHKMNSTSLIGQRLYIPQSTLWVGSEYFYIIYEKVSKTKFKRILDESRKAYFEDSFYNIIAFVKTDYMSFLQVEKIGDGCIFYININSDDLDQKLIIDGYWKKMESIYLNKTYWINENLKYKLDRDRNIRLNRDDQEYGDLIGFSTFSHFYDGQKEMFGCVTKSGYNFKLRKTDLIDYTLSPVVAEDYIQSWNLKKKTESEEQQRKDSIEHLLFVKSNRLYSATNLYNVGCRYFSDITEKTIEIDNLTPMKLYNISGNTNQPAPSGQSK